MQFNVRLTPVRCFAGTPHFLPGVPSYNPGRDASCLVFSVTPCWLNVIQPRMEKCMVFCTFVRVNFLAESAPESMQNSKIFRGDSPGPDPTAGGGDTPPSTAVIGGKRPSATARTQTVMLWGRGQAPPVLLLGPRL